LNEIDTNPAAQYNLNMNIPGILYIVATPIGNLADISSRALDVLKSVNVIAAEDTRHTKILLDHYGIRAPLTSYFEHNERRKTRDLVRQLQEGRSVALVSNAGTPGVSDPGYRVISEAVREGIKVVAIPGASALLAALVSSGKPMDKFLFEGFLPVKPLKRKKRLKELLAQEITVVAYESPYRILKALGDLASLAPQRQIVCARALTKKFEEILRGTPQEILAHFEQNSPQGEFTLVL